jgi:hypothetical protein
MREAAPRCSSISMSTDIIPGLDSSTRSRSDLGSCARNKRKSLPFSRGQRNGCQ